MINMNTYKILLATFTLLISFNTRAQFYAGGFIGTSTSKTFRHFGQDINNQQGVTDKLGNFWFAKGYSVGFELPGAIMPGGGVLNFNFRHLTATTSMEQEVLGRTQYKQVQNQYLVPVGLSKISDNGTTQAGVVGCIIVGGSQTRLEKQMLDQTGLDKTYKAFKANIGLSGAFIYVHEKVGFMTRIAWVGNMIPGKEQSELSAGALQYLNYTHDGEKRTVKADFKGISAELCAFLWLPKKSMDWNSNF